MAQNIIVENSLIAINKESTYGTYTESGQTAIPVQSGQATTDPTLESREDDRVGDIFPLTSLPTQLKHMLEYVMKLYPGDEIGLILTQMFGNPSSSADTPEAGANTHVYTLTEANITDNSLSLEESEAGLTADDYGGVMFDKITFSGGNSGYITCSFSGGAQSRVGGAVMSPVVITTEKPYRFFNAVVSYNSSQVKVQSWEISIDLKLLLENFKQSQTTEKPVLNGRPAVTAKFERHLEDRTYRTDFEAGTTRQFKVVLTHSDNIGATSTKFSLKLELPTAQIQSGGTSGDSGKKPESIEMMGFSGTSEGSNTTSFEATLINGTASYA